MSKIIKVALLDFDGTLVTTDILDLLCGVVGKAEESKQINEAYHRGELPGLSGLISRINLLSGVSEAQIDQALEQNSYLMPGAQELMKFFKDQQIMTILASGNILPVLKYYQKLLGFDYIVGSVPKMDGDRIIGISEAAFSSKNFKIDGINKILQSHGFEQNNIIALGDSPSDKGMFDMSGFSIAVNPKGDIARFAEVVVKDDLRAVIKIIEQINHTP